MQAPEKTRSAAGSALRVLVVDDDKNIRVTLGVCLEAVGCQVRSVALPPGSTIRTGCRPSQASVACSSTSKRSTRSTRRCSSKYTVVWPPRGLRWTVRCMPQALRP